MQEQIKTQETLEEAIDKYASNNLDSSFYELDDHFRAGAKWQQERMYSEEEVLDMMFEVLNHKREECCVTYTTDSIVRKVFKQFKNK